MDFSERFLYFNFQHVHQILVVQASLDKLHLSDLPVTVLIHHAEHQRALPEDFLLLETILIEHLVHLCQNTEIKLIRSSENR